MAVTVEIWVDYILERIRRRNPHLGTSFSESDQVLGGKIVHISQSGSNPEGVKNPTVYPLGVKQQVDRDIVYVLDNYVIKPTHITNIEQAEINYNKMNDVLGDKVNFIAQWLGDDIIYKWVQTYADQLAAPRILRTTGGASALTTASHLGTGNKLKLVFEDLLRAKTAMNNDDIDLEDRYALMSSEMMGQLQSDKDLILRDYAQEVDLVNGVIGRLCGFNLLERSKVITYTNDGTPVAKPYEAAAAVTDNDAVVCYHRNSVAMAQGAVNFYETLGDALYQGDIYSANVRMGGRSRRDDSKGIVVIVQATA